MPQPFHIPWFMFDIDNVQLILSKPIPTEIADKKGILITEAPIPGLNYQPMEGSGNKNREISFSLPIIKRNNHVGNMLLLKQFENLRNQSTGLLELTSSGQFKPNPEVLYYWGTGSIPLIYKVSKCDFKHDGQMVNRWGVPQMSQVDISLKLDENNLLFAAEEIFRKVASIAGMVINAFDVIGSLTDGSKPY